MQITDAFNTEKKIHNITITYSQEDEEVIKANLANYGNEFIQNTLITKELVAENLAKAIDTCHNIMNGKINLEPYLPWNNDGYLDTDVPIVLMDTPLYIPIQGTQILCKFQLKLLPEVEKPNVNDTEYEKTTWYLFLDAVPWLPNAYKPVIKSDGTLQPYHVTKGKRIAHDKLEHGCMYGDQNNALWLFFKNVGLTVTNVREVNKQKEQPQISRFTSSDIAIRIDQPAFNTIFGSEIGHDYVSKVLCSLSTYDDDRDLTYGLGLVDPHGLSLTKKVGKLLLNKEIDNSGFTSTVEEQTPPFNKITRKYDIQIM